MSKEQFLRLERLIGSENVQRLHESRVTLCGVGAVGGYALESLARCGVGHITIVDADSVSPTNLNRQIIALHSTIGRRKVEVAKERVLDINPECEVTALDLFLGDSDHDSIVAGSHLVLDCIDTVSAKIALIGYCVQNQVPIISSMGAALRRDLTKIRVADISKTSVCPLARAVRRGLRKRGITEGVKVVYSTEEVEFDFIPPSEDPHAEAMREGGSARTVLGSLSTVTATFGEYMAHEAIKSLLSLKS